MKKLIGLIVLLGSFNVEAYRDDLTVILQQEADKLENKFKEQKRQDQLDRIEQKLDEINLELD